jgi:hypothetical protein
MRTYLPEIPVLRTMHCEDHATYVVPYADKQAFLEYWMRRGLKATIPILTEEFPAEHIALVERPGQTRTCEQMVGLSVSKDPNSPINKLCELMDARGPLGKLQHIAYSVESTTEMTDVRKQLEDQGVVFMTPILEYRESNGAALRQMFVACKVPFGPFIEILQRTCGSDGIPFQGFHSRQIDALYRAYNTYSLRMEEAEELLKIPGCHV